MKKGWIYTLFLLLPVFAAIFSFFTVNDRVYQADMPIPYKAEFVGEYSYDGEQWLTYTEESPLSAVEGNLILRGHFVCDEYEMVRLNFYRNHIGVHILVNKETVYMDAVSELSMCGIDMYPALCGKEWSYAFFSELSPEDEVEIRFINLHKSGNETAYRDFLEHLYFGANNNDVFNAYIRPYIKPFETMGGILCVISLMLLGAAVASIVMKIGMQGKLLCLGLLCLFSGGYMMYDAMFLFETDALLVANTYGRQLCMMFGMSMLCLLTVEELDGRVQKISNRVFLLLTGVDTALLILSGTEVMLLFDTQQIWLWVHVPFCLGLIGTGLGKLARERKIQKDLCIYLLVHAAVLADVVIVFDDLHYRGIITKVTILILCIIRLAMAARQLILNYQGSVRAARLEEELTDMRIATMLSQIKPHFIYNTLGTIEQFCHEDGEKAADLVQKFSKYLRGNFTELDNVSAIRISQELDHVRHYVSIEEIRFPDMEVEYDLQAGEFLLPALTVQPLVENAIKHGLMGLESGGKVEIRTYETESAYCVEVEDNGIGFQKKETENDRKHVGLRNIRGRIEAMCNGTLTIESEVGKGTRALISIPKEG